MRHRLRRVASFFRRRRLEDELAEEMRLHIELRRQALIRDGMEPEAASREARRRFGNVTALREETRDMWSLPRLETILHDLQYGARVLRRAPLFSVVAVASLAVGIAASTLVYSVVNATLFSWLEMYRDPDRLFMVWQTRNAERWTPTPADFRDWRAENRSFAGIDAYTYSNISMTGEGDPERLLATATTPGTFQTLGVTPALGRGFVREEETWGRHRRVLLSDGFWRQRFGADPRVVGRRLILNGEPYDVVGVMPPGTWFTASRPDVWIPLAFAPDDPANGRNSHFIWVIARLRDGVSLEAANTELGAIATRIAELHPSNRGLSARAVPLQTQILGDTQETMRVVVAAVVFVLLIACANVASLLLVRASNRERELAIRASLGAGRARVVRQMLTESVLLATLGGLAGAALAWWAASRAAAALPANLPRLHETGVPVDWRMLAFAMAVTLVVGLLAGVLPSVSAGRGDTLSALKEGGRTATAAGRHVRIRSLLIAAEIAVALVLVTGAALLARSLGELQRASIGVRTTELLTMRLPLAPGDRAASDPAKTTAYLASIVERVQAVPGIVDADVTSHVPLTGGGQSKYFHVVGRAPAATLDETPTVSTRQEGPKSLQAMGARLIAGRLFTAGDTAANIRVAVINDTLARRFFPDENPLGKVIMLEPPESLAPPDFVKAAGGSFVRWTIVGIVQDISYGPLTSAPEAVVHVPYQQRTTQALMGWAPEFFVVRTTRDTTSVVADIRASLRKVAPAQPIADVRPIESIVRSALREKTLVTSVLSAFSLVALFLTAVGIYGVVASTVSARSHELGVRMALGARPASVVWLVLRQIMLVSGLSVAAGLVTAVASARLLSSQLYGVTTMDRVAFLAAPAIVVLMTAAAAWLPARRAARIDPLVALRTE